MRQLSHHVLLLLASGTTAAGTGVVTGSTIDTQGYDSVTFVVTLGAVTATGTNVFKLQGGAAANGSDKADIEGASVAGDDTMSNKKLVLEIHRPDQRYITPVLTRATANTAVVSIEALLYGADRTPVDQSQIAEIVSLVQPDLA